jgi:hypothetical protein
MGFVIRAREYSGTKKYNSYTKETSNPQEKADK